MWPLYGSQATLAAESDRLTRLAAETHTPNQTSEEVRRWRAFLDCEDGRLEYSVGGGALPHGEYSVGDIVPFATWRTCFLSSQALETAWENEAVPDDIVAPLVAACMFGDPVRDRQPADHHAQQSSTADHYVPLRSLFIRELLPALRKCSMNFSGETAPTTTNASDLDTTRTRRRLDFEEHHQQGDHLHEADGAIDIDNSNVLVKPQQHGVDRVQEPVPRAEAEQRDQEDHDNLASGVSTPPDDAPDLFRGLAEALQKIRQITLRALFKQDPILDGLHFYYKSLEFQSNDLAALVDEAEENNEKAEHFQVVKLDEEHLSMSSAAKLRKEHCNVMGRMRACLCQEEVQLAKLAEVVAEEAEDAAEETIIAQQQQELLGFSPASASSTSPASVSSSSSPPGRGQGRSSLRKKAAAAKKPKVFGGAVEAFSPDSVSGAMDRLQNRGKTLLGPPAAPKPRNIGLSFAYAPAVDCRRQVAVVETRLATLQQSLNDSALAQKNLFARDHEERLILEKTKQDAAFRESLVESENEIEALEGRLQELKLQHEQTSSLVHEKRRRKESLAGKTSGARREYDQKVAQIMDLQAVERDFVRKYGVKVSKEGGDCLRRLTETEVRKKLKAVADRLADVGGEIDGGHNSYSSVAGALKRHLYSCRREDELAKSCSRTTTSGTGGEDLHGDEVDPKSKNLLTIVRPENMEARIHHLPAEQGELVNTLGYALDRLEAAQRWAERVSEFPKGDQTNRNLQENAVDVLRECWADSEQVFLQLAPLLEEDPEEDGESLLGSLQEAWKHARGRRKQIWNRMKTVDGAGRD